MKLNRITAAVLATSMVLSVSASAMALTPEATVPTKNTTVTADRIYMSPVQTTQVHYLNPLTNHDFTQIRFQFPYWKLAVRNNTSHRMIINLYQDAPNTTVGKYIKGLMEVPPYSFKEFYCETPLESVKKGDTSYPDKVYAKDGLAYIEAHLPDGSITLDGTIWYKSATTAEYLRSTEAEPGK